MLDHHPLRRRRSARASLLVTLARPLVLPLVLPLTLISAMAADVPAAQRAPPIVPMDAATIHDRCDGEIARVRQQVSRMASAKEAGGGLLAGFNRLEGLNGQFSNPVALLSEVAVDKATRDAAQVCIEKFTPLASEIFQNRSLYQRVVALQPADAVDRAYRQDLLDRFDDAGASLPAVKRVRAKAIAERIEILGLAFQKAINEDPTTVVLAPEDADGLPADWLAARRRDDAGRLVLRMDYPTVVPFLQNATQEAPRRKVWIAFQNQGGPDNLARLDEVLALRFELARLHGQPDYASFALRQRMARTPAAVDAFLGQVREAVRTLEQQELQELRAEKAAALGQPLAAVQVQRWDTTYLQERIKRGRYAIDQEALRAYFPTDASVRFAMRVAERLYGIEFVAAALPVWHPDVRSFAVYDRLPARSISRASASASDLASPSGAGKRGAFLGTVYLDLVPREGKYNHAAAFGVVSGSTLAGRKPASVLVTNFNPKGLDHDELETLLHEFGHVLHGVLSQTRYAAQSGTAVKLDFVEAPSQMFEEWARRPQTLAVFAEVCPSCPRLSPEQLTQLDAARTFGRGLRYSRQWEYARYDMRLHAGTPQPALQTWIDLEQTMPLGYVEGSTFPAGFGHLMGGYAAGYYGYMWSEVMALDMLSAFDGDLMNPATGRRYRQQILSRGGEVPPAQMVERFLGRKPTPDAFFAEVTGRR